MEISLRERRGRANKNTTAIGEYFLDFFTSDPGLRLSFFAAVLVLMALWEALAPRRRTTAGKSMRWFSNLGLVCFNTLIVRLILPVGLVSVAMIARERGWGLLNNFQLPSWLAITISVVALDFVIYLQHVLLHAVPLLWRLHMVHHADLDIDVTTGVRFHTVEILLSMGIKSATVVLLGAPALAVLLFEILLNATSMFGHGNVRLSLWLDRVLRLFVVTPDMHRVHHSVIVAETNSNFGFNLPWWDFLFGTYRSQPAEGHEGMTIGLSQFRDERVERLDWMLGLPFLGETGDYPINRRGGKNRRPDSRETVSAGSRRPVGG
jgi:sterol desaturase/sphingolipid hydroxylase (fatty acid hydroxylase superfamily)